MVLVLDDYHLIDAQRGTPRSASSSTTGRLPCGWCCKPGRSAAGTGAAARRGQLAELREAELRFTAEEAAALLHQAAGSAPPEDAVAALTARTERWVVGLQLASLSLRQHSDVAGFLATFSGSHRHVLDYLTEEG